MELPKDSAIRTRIERIRHLSGRDQGSTAWFEAATLAQSVDYDAIGGHHPLMNNLSNALTSSDYDRAVAASRVLVSLWEKGGLKGPRPAIAHEIDSDVLDMAQEQAAASERSTDATHKQLQLAIAAFLAGASLEDALRRICDSRGVAYDPKRTSISKLQAAIRQHSFNRPSRSKLSRRLRTSGSRFGETHATRLTMADSVT